MRLGRGNGGLEAANTSETDHQLPDRPYSLEPKGVRPLQ
jgi:hypothetical protein